LSDCAAAQRLEDGKVNFCNVGVSLLSFSTGKLVCALRTIKGERI